MPLQLAPTFRENLAEADRPLIGMWVSSGSPLIAEICAGSGLDWLLIDGEHGPVGLESILVQLQAVAGYPITPIVRAPSDDTVIIKQFLDLGVQNLLVPMVNTAEQARSVVAAVRYPPRGVRGVGSALARASRWNRIDNYVDRADECSSLVVQIETADAVANAAEIANVDGVDGVFVGPADLAASMGLLGQQEHPNVVAAVEQTIRTVEAAGKPVGVNAFVPAMAERYLAAGANFVAVGADVTVLARGSESLAAKYIPSADPAASPRASY